VDSGGESVGEGEEVAIELTVGRFCTEEGRKGIVDVRVKLGAELDGGRRWRAAV